MNESRTPEQATDMLGDAARQATYAFFADLFLEPIPVDDAREDSAGAAGATSFVDDLVERASALAAVEGLDPAIRAPFDSFLAACEGDRAALQRQIAIDRSALFRATRQAAGPLPPNEGLYRADQPERTTMQELNAFYARFGSGVADGTHERPDYLGAEAAFMAELIRATIDATGENGETEGSQRGMRGQRDFVVQHLARWVPSCCDTLIGHAQTDAMRGLLGLLRDFIEEERARFDGR